MVAVRGVSGRLDILVAVRGVSGGTRTTIACPLEHVLARSGLGPESAPASRTQGRIREGEASEAMLEVQHRHPYDNHGLELVTPGSKRTITGNPEHPF